MTARATRRLTVALLATLGACTEADPLSLEPPEGLGAAGRSATQPKFEPYRPPTPTGGGGGGGSAATGGGGTGGVVVGGTGGTATAPTGPFVPIPELDPIAMDAAGSFVVGNRQVLGLDRAFVWSAATRAAVPLPLESYGENAASGMSADAVFIVGAEYTHHQDLIEAVRWVRSDMSFVLRLGFASPSHDRSWSSGVSADGASIACTSLRTASAPANQRAFRWKDATVRVIEPLPGDTGTDAILISAGGSAIAGYSFGEDRATERLFVWSDDTGNTTEVVIPDKATRLVPRYFSHDGSVLIGEAITGTLVYPHVVNVVSRRAFRWTRQGAVFIMPVDARSQIRVDGASADGTVVLATSFDSVGGMDLRPMPFVATTTVSAELGGADVSSSVLDPTGKVVAGIGVGLGGRPALIFSRVAAGLPLSISTIPPLPFPLPTSPSTLVAITAGGRTLLGQGNGPDGRPVAWLMATGLGPPPN